jgi:membrane-associated phospholipid phosphatase
LPVPERLRRLITPCGLLLALTGAGQCQAESFNSADADRYAGDLLQIAIPLTGLGLSWLKQDGEGGKQWFESMAGTSLATIALKRATDHSDWGERPNGGRFSFPSGHTASACAGAVFIGRRYGWNYGLPALLPAGFVGYSRVDHELHHWRDVIAGCALGAVTAAHFTNALLTPELSGHTMALHLTMVF